MLCTIWRLGAVFGVLVAVIVVASACGSTRVVRVPVQQPAIRDNVSTPAQVRAHFAGAPAHVDDVGGGVTCVYYGSTAKAIAGSGPVWVIRLCTRGLQS